jgi:hypothetical protein
MSEEVPYESIELEKSGEVVELLEARHILDDEIKMVIHHAEATGKKLYQPDNNRFLAKKGIGKATFYVEYEKGEGNTYRIRTAYSHRAVIEE